jgi:hypothetical protein
LVKKSPAFYGNPAFIRYRFHKIPPFCPNFSKKNLLNALPSHSFETNSNIILPSRHKSSNSSLFQVYIPIFFMDFSSKTVKFNSVLPTAPPVLMVVAGLEFVDTRAREENHALGNCGET